MNWAQISGKLRYYRQYIPFRINALVAGIAIWLCFNILKSNPMPAGENLPSFRPLILLMSKIALLFILTLIGFSVLTTLFCWLHYLWLRRKKNYILEFNFKPATGHKGLWLETLVRKARRPFLGFVKGRLFYDDYKMTDQFILASNKRKPEHFWRDAIAGKSILQLPDIKEYAIRGGFIYFEDMLQLFSLPVRQRIQGHFYQNPEQLALEDRETLPRKTEQTDTRIEQLRRVEGEYLNYKDFESGDDVRRIVWKVYAKNRELVVRVPEIFDPYASHVYYYASFHTTLPKSRYDSSFAAEMLNYYKNRIWTIYNTLTQKEWEVKFIPDQPLQIAAHTSPSGQVQRIISNSHWHQEKTLTDYFDPRNGSVLCISSFNSPEEVAALLELCGPDILVYYIKLSRTFHNYIAWTWIKRLFIQSPEDRLKKIRGRWILALWRFQLLKREKEIERLLAQANVTTGFL